MTPILVALMLAAQLLLPYQAAPPGVSVQVLEPQVTYAFGETIDFTAHIVSDRPLREINLFFQPGGEEARVGRAELDGDGRLTYSYPVSSGAIRPFAKVYYWFQVTGDDGSQTTSPSFSFDYQDNRFTWQHLKSGDLRVHWVQGDLAFGQEIANVAREGLAAAQKVLPLETTGPLDVYVYASAHDLQSALQLGGRQWVAGSASPDLGVVAVSIPQGPDQRLELERQVPHELTHVLLYRATGAGYAKLPAWLSEGIASLAELYPNPDYQRALDAARQGNDLLRIESLCQSFPKDASGAFLAYAEAASFTRFLRDNYGTSGVQALVQRYTDGMGCAQGVEAALGTSLGQLDLRWRSQTLAENTTWTAFKNLAPYLLLFLLLLAVTATPLLARRAHPVTRDGTKRI